MRALLLFLLTLPALAVPLTKAYLGSTEIHRAYLGANEINLGTPVPVGGAQMIVSFDVAGYETYTHRIELTPADAADKTLAAGVNSWTFTGLDFNTQYQVDVIRIDGSLNESSPITAMIYTAPEFGPTGFAAVADGENAISLSWTEPSPAPVSGYQIGISDDGTTWAELVNAGSGVAVFDATGLDGGTEYFFRIRAWNDNPSPHDDAVTAWSATVSATTDADITPPVLTAVGATPGDTEADLTMTSSEAGNIWWSVSTNATQTAAEIKAGTAAVDYDTSVCTAAVAVTATATGLTNGVTYYLHVVAEDAIPNQSLVTNTSPGFVPVVPPPTYLVDENFEGAGTPSGFIVHSGTPDFDFAVTPLEGLQSAYAAGYTNGESTRFDASYPVGNYREIYFLMRIDNIAATTSTSLMEVRNNTGGRGWLYVRAGKFRLGSTDGPDSVAGYVTGTIYHCWYAYDALTGVQTFAFSTDGIRPTSGDNYLTYTGTPSSPGPNKVIFYGAYSGVSNRVDVAFDRVLVSDTTISSNP